ncbi:IDEAL domain-containing protein [Bacillus pinisoli]|uniref:IDEAL domain-containing protein n=1 Tax=Bacillus pinisoli TaxID=2901866 RepID=UPI001FF5AFE7|nr:IDEAL domain-containing protein [Bacillus pinisoli]
MKHLRREFTVTTNKQHKYFSYKLTRDQEYSIQLQATLFLDEQCFLFNKRRIGELVNQALIEGNKIRFQELRSTYGEYYCNE